MKRFKNIFFTLLIAVLALALSVGCAIPEITVTTPEPAASPPPAPAEPPEPINPSWTPPPTSSSGNISPVLPNIADVVAKVKPSVVAITTEVVSFEGADQIERIVVSTKGGEKREMSVNGVFMAIGWGPNLDMLDISVETTQEGFIKTDNKLMTSFPGLFAAGDVRDTDIRQVITACADGARAATYAFEYLEGMKP